jgi:hypothetical protein
MRLRLRTFRRLVVVALPCWMLGGPLAATLQSVAACPHDAMPSSMHHGQGSEAPCWCPDMAGAGAIELPTLPASTTEPAVTITAAAAVTRVTRPESIALPPSPSFAPTPPPPNSLF